MTKTFEIKSITLGSATENWEIVFADAKQLEEAFKELDLDKDIQLKQGNVVTYLPRKMLSTKLYDGSLLLKANLEVRK